MILVILLNTSKLWIRKKSGVRRPKSEENDADIRLKDRLAKLKQDGWELTNNLRENPYYFIRKIKK